jgi:uncharacterized protein
MFSNYLSVSTFQFITLMINLAIFAGGLYLLFRAQKKGISFGNRVFLALAAGILLGLLLQLIYGVDSPVSKLSLSWINMVSGIYIGLLRMIVIPLVLVSVIMAILNLKGRQNIGKLGMSIISVLILTTAVAALVGALITSAFSLTSDGLEKGQAETNRVAFLETKFTEVPTDLPGQIVSFIPANPFQDMTGARSSSTIAVVIFASLLGFAMLNVSKRSEERFARLRGWIETLHHLVMELVKMVIRLTPYGLLALVTNIVAGSNWSQMVKLVNFVLISYLAIAVMFAIHFIILAFFGLNPITYLKKAWSTLTFAFISRSSAGTLPLTIKTQTGKLGVPESIANIGSSFAVTVGQNGCAGIYPAMLAVMVAPTLGINPLDPGFLIQLVIIVAIGSFGIAGVGGGATYAGLVVLSSLGFPIWIAALLISVEPLIDMGRTALNVSGAFVANLVTARMHGELDLASYNEVGLELVEELA